MCPLELTATPAASPRCISGGSFRRFATESYGISGGDCCAIADELSSMRSPTSPRFMVISLNRGQRYCEDDMFSRRWLKYTNERTCNTIASSGFRASVRQPTDRRTAHALRRCLQPFLSRPHLRVAVAVARGPEGSGQ